MESAISIKQQVKLAFVVITAVWLALACAPGGFTPTALAASTPTGNRASTNGASATLPAATQRMLDELGLPESILKGIERELAIPKAWLEAAKAEGSLRILGTWRAAQASILLRPFQERYPFISIDASSASQDRRVLGTLSAFRTGTYVTDVVASLGIAVDQYMKFNALDDLSSLPNYKNIPEFLRDPKIFSVSMRLRSWCLGYNTDRVAETELPKTWGQLVTDPRWRGGKLGIGNIPQVWVPQLWKVWGEKKTKAWLVSLFQDVRPQLRGENATALLGLTAAGEFDAILVAAEARVAKLAETGAPIGWHCPEIVPTSPSDIGVLANAPNINAARLFVNWLLSKEGQLAIHRVDGSPPVHVNLQEKRFVPFYEKIQGKQLSAKLPADEIQITPQVTEFWNHLWLRARGK